MISFDDFKKMELKTAKVLAVNEHPSADRLFVVDLDIGEEKKQAVAGIKGHYSPDELVGKNVAVVTNMEPATIRGVESQAMILAANSGETLAVLTLDKDLPAGTVIK